MVSAPKELCCAACSHARHPGNQEMVKKNRRNETAAAQALLSSGNTRIESKVMNLGPHSQHLGEGWWHSQSTGVSSSWILGFSTEL